MLYYIIHIILDIKNFYWSKKTKNIKYNNP